MKVADRIQSIIKANYGHEGPGVLQTRIVHAKSLVDKFVLEAKRIAGKEPPSEVALETHATNWVGCWGRVSQWSLVNYTGEFQGTYADTAPCDWRSPKGKRFHHADSYPVIARLLSSRPHLVNARLNVIWPGSGLNVHEENVILRMPDGHPRLKIRFHLPLKTNPKAWLGVVSWWYQLGRGIVYYVHNGQPHLAMNDGSEPRIHIVWDEILSSETADLLAYSHEPEGTPYKNIGDYPKESCPILMEEALEAMK